MARPRKQTVDYFPHDCQHGKTMYILEQRFANDGYAFWFKLLETLGSSDGHCIKFNQDTETEFLAAKTHMTIDKCIEILDLLAKLNAIDPELWQERIIWSDNFIERISDVYRKRESETPFRPPVMGVSDVGNSQSKVKETKVIEDEAVNYSTYIEIGNDEVLVSVVWGSVLELLKQRVIDSNYRSYLENLEALGTIDNEFYITAENGYLKDRIDTQFKGIIEEKIKEVTKQDWTLKCEVRR